MSSFQFSKNTIVFGDNDDKKIIFVENSWGMFNLCRVVKKQVKIHC